MCTSWPVLCGTLSRTPQMAGLLSLGSPLLSGTVHRSHDLDLPGLSLPPLYSGCPLAPPPNPEVPLPALHLEDCLRTTHQAIPGLTSFFAVSWGSLSLSNAQCLESNCFIYFSVLSLFEVGGQVCPCFPNLLEAEVTNPEEPFTLGWAEAEPRGQRLNLGRVWWAPTVQFWRTTCYYFWSKSKVFINRIWPLSYWLFPS